MKDWAEAVAPRCSVKKVFLKCSCEKKMFLKISQNSQENTCARASFLIKLQATPATLLKAKLWHRCFPVNFAKFLRTSFFYRTPPVAASDYQPFVDLLLL